MVRVTAAVLEKAGKILIAKRRDDDHLAGLWEFPGGKIEYGEDPRDCLARELHEEFGITAQIGDFLVSHVHRYPHVEIELLSYSAAHVAGEFELRAHDEVRWVSPDEFDDHSFAPADLPTVWIVKQRHRAIGEGP
jgi:8-oxo-dGTP diphosphatase